MQEREKYMDYLTKFIEKKWGYMLRFGATSFWETINGAKDFDDGGSLCHGWSAMPVYFYYAYVLGVRPVAPGFAEYTLDPIGKLIKGAKVPTPNGVINIM
jgi:hypothetical protein